MTAKLPFCEPDDENPSLCRYCWQKIWDSPSLCAGAGLRTGFQSDDAPSPLPEPENLSTVPVRLQRVSIESEFHVVQVGDLIRYRNLPLQTTFVRSGVVMRTAFRELKQDYPDIVIDEVVDIVRSQAFRMHLKVWGKESPESGEWIEASQIVSL